MQDINLKMFGVSGGFVSSGTDKRPGNFVSVVPNCRHTHTDGAHSYMRLVGFEGSHVTCSHARRMRAHCC